MSDATWTVKFNVGGRHFEVSRALIDGHSETALGKLVSETWNNDPGKAVFIDRSGDIFAHVLEYLRYGSIEIPTTIPRSMFERELDYYGITSADYLITVEDSVVTTLKSFIKEEFVKTKREHEMCLLALECYNQFYQSCNASGIVFIRQGHKLFNRTKSSLDFEEKKLLDYYLGRHGLMVDGRHENNTVCRGGGCFFVCTKR